MGTGQRHQDHYRQLTRSYHNLYTATNQQLSILSSSLPVLPSRPSPSPSLPPALASPARSLSPSPATARVTLRTSPSASPPPTRSWRPQIRLWTPTTPPPQVSQVLLV